MSGMSLWILQVGVALVLVLAACSDGETTTSNADTVTTTNETTVAVTCEEPPSEELLVVSPLEMALDPNPVLAGHRASLVVSPPPSRFPLMGVDLDWMCWDGSGWVMTHKLVTDDVPAGPLIYEHPPPSGVTTTIPDLGVWLGSSSGIEIPDVGPGTYRLQTSRPTADVTPFVLVEIVAPSTPTPDQRHQ